MYEIFEKLLRDKNITAYRVAKEVGISQSSLSEWKYGRSRPKYEKLMAIAKYFNVSIEYLLGKPDAVIQIKKPDPERIALWEELEAFDFKGKSERFSEIVELMKVEPDNEALKEEAGNIASQLSTHSKLLHEYSELRIKKINKLEEKLKDTFAALEEYHTGIVTDDIEKESDE